MNGKTAFRAWRRRLPIDMRPKSVNYTIRFFSLCNKSIWRCEKSQIGILLGSMKWNASEVIKPPGFQVDKSEKEKHMKFRHQAFLFTPAVLLACAPCWRRRLRRSSSSRARNWPAPAP